MIDSKERISVQQLDAYRRAGIYTVLHQNLDSGEKIKRARAYKDIQDFIVTSPRAFHLGRKEIARLYINYSWTSDIGEEAELVIAGTPDFLARGLKEKISSDAAVLANSYPQLQIHEEDYEKAKARNFDLKR